MVKKNILFVVLGFYQAGAEKFMYEVDKALNKNEFNTTILCLEHEKEISPIWNVRHFEKKHVDLGSNIIYIDRFLSIKKKSTVSRVLNKLTRNKFRKQIYKYKIDFYDFLDSYDIIHWMGEYTFEHTTSESIKNKSLIHSMSARFQSKDIYKLFDFEYPYNFISPFMDSEIEYEFIQFSNIKHYFIPLAMDLSSIRLTWRYNDTEIIKIGIFTRLSPLKPLDPFFYSFQLLLEKIPNAELHIYGTGDPNKEGMIAVLKRLGILDKVFFRGHQDSISKTISNEHINLSWFQGYKNQRPAGYAGLEICATGLPLICWDFFDETPDNYNDVYPHYKNMTEFVNKSAEIILDKNKAEDLSSAQFNDILENRDINKYIKGLENIYKLISSKH